MKKILFILTATVIVLTFGTAYAKIGTTMDGAGAPDTLLNYIDPSSVPGFVNPENGVVTPAPKAFSARGSAAGGISALHDSLLNDLDPSRVPGYVNPESGVITGAGAL